MHACMYVYICPHTYTHTYTYIQVNPDTPEVDIWVDINIYINIYTPAYIHIHIHTYRSIQTLPRRTSGLCVCVCMRAYLRIMHTKLARLYAYT